MLFGMICVCVCFDNVDGILVLGFYVCVKVGGSVLYEVLFVDDVVINIDQDKKFVFVVDQQGCVLYCEVQ